MIKSMYNSMVYNFHSFISRFCTLDNETIATDIFKKTINEFDFKATKNDISDFSRIKIKKDFHVLGHNNQDIVDLINKKIKLFN